MIDRDEFLSLHRRAHNMIVVGHGYHLKMALHLVNSHSPRIAIVRQLFTKKFSAALRRTFVELRRMLDQVPPNSPEFA